MNTHSSLTPPPPPPPFLNGRNEISKKWVGGAIFKKICMGNQKVQGRGNTKVVGRCDFFIFIFSLLAMIVIDTIFEKSSLRNPFLKKWSMMLLSIGHII